MKREKGGSKTNYNSWNKAKEQLTVNEYNRRRSNNACIKCGELGHKFNDYPKPKPWLLESVVDSTIPATRTHISELPSIIDESCAIKLKTDYIIDSTEHHLNDALAIREEIVSTSLASSTIVRTLGTNMDTTSSPLMKTSEEVLHSGGGYQI